jgi:O-antigen ligase
MKKIIFYLFAALFFLVPLVLWPYTSEVFEFNKIVLVYILTTGIVASWAVRSVIERKFIFRRTIIDKTLLIFFSSQLVATLLSVDFLTSLLGYYSRFNGGLVSVACYILLYWAFVSNFDKKDTLRLIKYSLFPSAVLVSLYGVAEHFGIDKDIWVQDVQKRVFSTLGQPNWLAAWLVALLPVTWAFMVSSKLNDGNTKPFYKSLSFWVYFSLSGLFFWTLIFTASRSGLLGFVVAFVLFWGGHFWFRRKSFKKTLPHFAIILLSFVAISLISGTQYTPGIKTLITRSTTQPAEKPQGPALETGGTESGTIRKIVWKGALDIWAHYPVFGTGVETFAFSYYQFRPAEHNLVSEWDFIYNKAHNDFLNMAANSGTVGLVSYLILIGFIGYQIIKFKKGTRPSNTKMALLAGFSSLMVTNFFGFSVVPTQITFFLFPAFAFTLGLESESKDQKNKWAPDATQKFFIIAILIFIFYFLFLIFRYWTADLFYAKGWAYNAAQRPDLASEFLLKAINLKPNQALYHSELSSSYVTIAIAQNQKDDTEKAKIFSDMAIAESDKAMTLSPANPILKRKRFGVFIMLSTIDPIHMATARDVLIEAIKQAPSDAKLYYNLGLTYARTGEPELAMTALKKTIELKPNYREARLAYAIVLIDKSENALAREQLEYILTHIDPNDSLTKQTLESIK